MFVYFQHRIHAGTGGMETRANIVVHQNAQQPEVPNYVRNKQDDVYPDVKEGSMESTVVKAVVQGVNLVHLMAKAQDIVIKIQRCVLLVATQKRGITAISAQINVATDARPCSLMVSASKRRVIHYRVFVLEDVKPAGDSKNATFLALVTA